MRDGLTNMPFGVEQQPRVAVRVALLMFRDDLGGQRTAVRVSALASGPGSGTRAAVPNPGSVSNGRFASR